MDIKAWRSRPAPHCGGHLGAQHSLINVHLFIEMCENEVET